MGFADAPALLIAVEDLMVADDGEIAAGPIESVVHQADAEIHVAGDIADGVLP